MRAIKIMPGQRPEVINISSDYKELRNIIGGIVEYVPMEKNLMLLCDEEFKLKNLELNRRVEGINIAGPILIIGGPEDEESVLTGLTDEDIVELKSKYMEIPTFTDEEKKQVPIIEAKIISW